MQHMIIEANHLFVHINITEAEKISRTEQERTYTTYSSVRHCLLCHYDDTEGNSPYEGIGIDIITPNIHRVIAITTYKLFIRVNP
jgi:hypothetical protein